MAPGLLILLPGTGDPELRHVLSAWCGHPEPGAARPNPVRHLTEAPTSTPSSTATSADLKAHVEFYRPLGRFVLVDDYGDSRSAVLQYQVDGRSYPDKYTSKGNGSRKPIELPVPPDDRYEEFTSPRAQLLNQRPELLNC